MILKKRFFEFFEKNIQTEIFDPNLCQKWAKTGFPKENSFWQKHFSEIYLTTFFQTELFWKKHSKHFGIFLKLFWKEKFQKFFWKIIFPTGSEAKFFEKKIVLKLFWEKAFFERQNCFCVFWIFSKNVLCKCFWKNNLLTNLFLKNKTWFFWIQIFFKHNFFGKNNQNLFGKKMCCLDIFLKSSKFLWKKLYFGKRCWNFITLKCFSNFC